MKIDFAFELARITVKTEKESKKIINIMILIVMIIRMQRNAVS